MSNRETPTVRLRLAVLLTAGALWAACALCADAQARTHHRAKGAWIHCSTARHATYRHRCGHSARYRAAHRRNAKRKKEAVQPTSATTRAVTSAPAPAEPQTCTGTELIPTSSNLDEVRAATLCLINRERELHGEVALKENPQLLSAAQGHSEDMVARDYFDHTTPSGEALGARILASGYVREDQAYMLGENIDCATLFLASPAATVKAWMNSQGHRENILNGEFRESGMGVAPSAPPSFAEGQPGATYTQDFGVIGS